MNGNQPTGATGAIERIDRFLQKAAKIYSYVGNVAIVVMSLLAVGDILAAKLFSKAIPNQYQWVQYLLILAVFTVVPSVTLGRGMMSVDILTRKFPKKLLVTIEFLAYACGTVIFAFLSYRGWLLMVTHIVEKTASANQTGAFLIWPFTLIYALSMALIALTCLWRAIRTVAVKKEGGENK